MDILRSRGRFSAKDGVTIKVVQKMWSRLNQEGPRKQAQQKKREEVEQARQDTTAWPSTESVGEWLDKGVGSIFSGEEKMQSLLLNGAPMGDNSDFDFRQSLLMVARHWDKGHKLFLLQNAAQTNAIILLVEGISKQSNGQPLFECFFTYNTSKKLDMGVLQLMSRLQGQHSGVASVACEKKELRIWLDKLRLHSLENQYCPGEPLLQRSCIPAPLPAASAIEDLSDDLAQMDLAQMDLAQMEKEEEEGEASSASSSGLGRPPKVGADNHSIVLSVRDNTAEADASIMTMSLGNGLLSGRQTKNGNFTKNGKLKKNLPSGRFVMKVQLPMVVPGMPAMGMLMYDKQRSFQRQFHPQEEGYAQLANAIIENGYMRAKLYVYATLEDKDQLRIFTKDLPQQKKHLGVW
jgi:hypothetical protein